MVNYNAQNVYLYSLGASGDNLISDGYVKAVEKVWIDSYTFGSTTLTTSDTILIGYVPANKKIVGVEIVIPQSWTPTTSTFNVGPSYSTSLLISSSSTYVGGTNSTLAGNTWKCTINNSLGQNFVTTQGTTSYSGGTIVTNVNHGIYLSIGTANQTAPTAGSLQTIIRYT